MVKKFKKKKLFFLCILAQQSTPRSIKFCKKNLLATWNEYYQVLRRTMFIIYKMV